MLTLAHDSTVPNPRRGWATLTSFAIQVAALGVALFIPLLRPDLLPRLDFAPRPVSISLSPAAPESVSHNSGKASVNPVIHPFSVPPSIPVTTNLGPDPSATQDDPPCPQCVPGVGTGGTGIPAGIDVIGIPVAPLPPKPVTKPPRISVMMDGYLIHRVQPDYPALAKQMRVQGPVALAAVISKDGAIERLHALAGHPMLIPSAMNAVKQWRYRPYILNGDPIEVDTEITVIFSLGGN